MLCVGFVMFFFFKQKTAYEMRISDWSSDVCSSDLIFLFPGAGKPVTAIDYRLTQRGFYEMTGVSHLGLAIPYLARLRELGFAGWESAARDLLVQCRVVRKT